MTKRHGLLFGNRCQSSSLSRWPHCGDIQVSLSSGIERDVVVARRRTPGKIGIVVRPGECAECFGLGVEQQLRIRKRRILQVFPHLAVGVGWGQIDCEGRDIEHVQCVHQRARIGRCDGRDLVLIAGENAFDERRVGF